MRLLKILFFGVAALLVAAIGIAFVLPAQVATERSVSIDRPPSMVHAVVDSFALFNRWSPWADLDPATRYTYEGPERGVGAAMAWASDDPSVGSGKQTITASAPGERVEIALDFGDFGTSQSILSIVPEGAGSKVTWRFATTLPITFDGKFFFGVLGRWFGLTMADAIGADYDKGLGKLKALLEGMPGADIAGLEALVQEVAAQPAYVVPGLSSGTDSASSSPVLGAAYGEIVALAQANNLKLAGPPYTVIRGHSGDQWQYDAGIPVDRNDVAPTGRVVAAQTHAGRVADFRHLGSYDTLGDTHAKAEAWLATRGLAAGEPRMEIYVSDPVSTPAAEVVSLVRIPLR
jgi:effector-binding domain-containing protein